MPSLLMQLYAIFDSFRVAFGRNSCFLRSQNSKKYDFALPVLKDYLEDKHYQKQYKPSTTIKPDNGPLNRHAKVRSSGAYLLKLKISNVYRNSPRKNVNLYACLLIFFQFPCLLKKKTCRVATKRTDPCQEN